MASPNNLCHEEKKKRKCKKDCVRKSEKECENKEWDENRRFEDERLIM